ncbi:hypothetical protein [Actinokineospora sp. HUAS TT18]|uniref:WXG100-like domain-containing protein n=1 Tax=Actinokineospora sp. HUAS TT18 TaxID=3447451 RepID=UPI003F5234B1
MPYADVEPVAAHLVAPAVDSSAGIEQLIADQSFQVEAVNWLFEWVTGKNLVETVIVPITGDWTTVGANAQAWRSAADAVEAVSTNLSANVDELRTHWSGAAAAAFEAHIKLVWFGGLAAEAGLARVVAKGFDTLATVSRTLCEEALELLEKLVNKIASAAVTWLIPVFGQARAVKAVWDAYQLYESIMDIIEAVKDVIAATQQLIDAVGTIRDALAAIPDIRDADDAVAVATQLIEGAQDAQDAAAQVVGASEAADQELQENVPVLTGANGGGSGSW